MFSGFDFPLNQSIDIMDSNICWTTISFGQFLFDEFSNFLLDNFNFSLCWYCF